MESVLIDPQTEPMGLDFRTARFARCANLIAAAGSDDLFAAMQSALHILQHEKNRTNGNQIIHLFMAEADH